MKTITKRKYWEKITAYFSKDLTDSELDKIEEWADLQDGKELLMELKENIKHIDLSTESMEDRVDFIIKSLIN